MAKVLDSFPVVKKKESRWAQFMDGKVWQLTQGEDFESAIVTADAAIRQAAVSRGLKVSICKIDSKTIVVQARKKL